MTKRDLIHRVHRTKGLAPGLTMKAIGQVVDAVFDEIGGYFVRVKVTRKAAPRLTYPGFGTFTKKRREARIGRDPQSGKPIHIPARVTVAFVPGVELKEQLNRK